MGRAGQGRLPAMCAVPAAVAAAGSAARAGAPRRSEAGAGAPGLAPQLGWPLPAAGSLPKQGQALHELARIAPWPDTLSLPSLPAGCGGHPPGGRHGAGHVRGGGVQCDGGGEAAG